MNPLAPSKCVPRLLMALAAMTSIALMAACGSGPGIGMPNPGGFSDSNLSGTYVFSVSGTDLVGAGSFFAIVGTITADGKGNITGGTVDINDLALGGTGVFTGQALSASTYNVTQDGRGTATLNTPQGNLGLAFVLTSSNHGLITRFDPNGSGSGTLESQGSASQSSLASLAFTLSGVDASGNALGTVGAFTLNSSGTVTSGIEDVNDNGGSPGGLTGLPVATTSSLVLTSATNGTAQLDSSFGSLAFDVWVVDSTHLKFIETDTSGVVLSGDAFTQQTTFTAGQLVFTLGGLDSTLTSPLAAGGIVTTDANGTLSNGSEDYNDGGNANTVTNVSGACTTFAAGRCQLALTGFSNGTLGNFVFAAYPSSGGIQLLEIDNLGLMQGAAYAQTATSFAASQGYGLNLSGANFDSIAGFWFEVDDIAQFNASSATNSPNMIGVLDENDVGFQLASRVPLSGTYAPDSPATGRGLISVPNLNTFIGTLNLAYYVVDPSTILFVEGDSSQVAMGIFELQSSSSTAAARPAMPMVRSMVRSHAAIRRK
jgi:hypothetical protein